MKYLSIDLLVDDWNIDDFTLLLGDFKPWWLYDPGPGEMANLAAFKSLASDVLKADMNAF